MNPSFASTSPFYLKASIAALHILSVYLILSSSSSYSVNHSASRPTTQESPKPQVLTTEKSDLWSDALLAAEIMFNTTLDSLTYFPSFLFQRGNENNTFFQKPTDANTSSFFQASSSTEEATFCWITETMKSFRMHFIMHHITGPHGFIYLPAWCCLLSLLTGCIPSITSFTKYREDVVAIVLPTMVYIITVAQITAMLYVGNVNMIMMMNLPLPMICSALILHASAHAMFQCMSTYQQRMACKRVFLSGSVMFLSVNVLGIACIYWFSLATPTVMYKIPSSIKDMFVIHAITSFFPECYGVLFMGILKGIQRLTDASEYSKPKWS